MANRNKSKSFLSIAIAIVITLNLCGCGNKKDKDKIYAKFLEVIETIDPNYEHPELYLGSDEIDEILRVTKTTKECSNRNSDYSNLENLIIENSLKYSNEDNFIFIDYNCPQSNKNEDIDRDIVLRVSLRKALDKIFKNNANSSEDICRLKNLVIFSGSLQDENDLLSNELSFAAYIGDDTVIVDYDALLIGYEKIKAEGSKLTFIDFVALNLEHELNHARAVICDCRKDAGQEYETFNYKQTLMSAAESSAESQLYSDNIDMFRNNREAFVYQAERYQEALLLFLVAFKENKNISDYYQALNSSNLEGLYEFFGLEDKKDCTMFYHITETMDAIVERNGVGYFLSSNNYDTCNKREEVLGYTYKLEIFKESLGDLVNYQNSQGDLSLEEIMFLYNLVKTYITSGTVEKVGSENVYLVFDEEFLSYFIPLEEAFYEYIMAYFGVDKEEIAKASDKSIIYAKELLEGNSKLTRDLETRFPLIRFIYSTLPISVSNLDDYSNDAKMILARNKD